MVTGVNTNPAAATQSQSATDRTTLAGNFNTFLTLLTSQLQNQDPLSPMDSTQFTQQLVQFSGVEQQIRTNENLEGLAAQYQAASAGAALSYLGKDAIIEANNTTLSGGQAAWAYSLPATASDLTINVKDSSGRTIYSTTTSPRGEGQHLFSWDGKRTDGGVAPDGVYTLDVEATDAEGKDITSTTSVRERIMGVDFSGTSPSVITSSGDRELSTLRTILTNSSS